MSDQKSEPFYAADAKKITANANAAREDISGILAHAYAAIRAAAGRGLNRIDPPWVGLRQPVSHQQMRDVTERLVADGYTVSQNGTVSW